MTHPTDLTSETPAQPDSVAALAQQIDRARGRVAIQSDPALIEMLTDGELKAAQDDAQKIRRRHRSQQRRIATATIKAEKRAAMDQLRAEADEQRIQSKIRASELRDQLRAQRALAEHQRTASPHAQLADLYTHRSRSAWAMAAVVIAAMVISATNVQHNLAPNTTWADPSWWTAYFIEALVSVCLVVLMVGTPKAAQWGITDGRGKVMAAEIGLLVLTILLNTFPYIRNPDLFGFGTHAVAPTMIGVAILIHHAMSQRYSKAVAKAAGELDGAAAATNHPEASKVAGHSGQAIAEHPIETAVVESEQVEVSSRRRSPTLRTARRAVQPRRVPYHPARRSRSLQLTRQGAVGEKQVAEVLNLRADSEPARPVEPAVVPIIREVASASGTVRDWTEVAQRLSSSAIGRNPAVVAEILHLSFDRAMNPTQVAAQVGMRERTVSRIVDDAHPYRLASALAS
ncbi:hypothetical protein [Nocardia salmonicida]|uniref:hypothetical protein n=1 Tax=Nocardia salmonicida TaxID=53431 RepID=UPI0007A39B4D|nr:hypothetical protein [Nocardia salmonicida]MBC7299780.1 hypothetical protein [Nocardia sp.]